MKAMELFGSREAAEIVVYEIFLLNATQFHSIAIEEIQDLVFRLTSKILKKLFLSSFKSIQALAAHFCSTHKLLIESICCVCEHSNFYRASYCAMKKMEIFARTLNHINP